MDMQSDSELVKAVLDGNRQAYGELFRRHERSVQATALSVLDNLHAAQDAMQEAFVTAFCKLGTLRKHSSFGPWVQKIARHEAIQVRRQWRKAKDAQRPTIQPHTPTNNGQIDERNRQLIEAVMRLPEHERTVVMLRYFEDHSVKTIGQMTGRPVGTVTMQLSRARARLQRWLKDALI
jgi:RNA polymerase sigma-70 factor, ECF subfamily